MLGLLATLMFLAATLFALVAVTMTVQVSWTRIVSALTMNAPPARAARRNVIRVKHSFRTTALARFSPRGLSAAA